MRVRDQRGVAQFHVHLERPVEPDENRQLDEQHQAAAQRIVVVLAEQLLLGAGPALDVFLVFLLQLLDLGLKLLHLLGVNGLLAAQREHAQADQDRQHDDGQPVVARDGIEEVQRRGHRLRHPAEPAVIEQSAQAVLLQQRRPLRAGEHDEAVRNAVAGLQRRRLADDAERRVGNGFGSVTSTYPQAQRRGELGRRLAFLGRRDQRRGEVLGVDAEEFQAVAAVPRRAVDQRLDAASSRRRTVQVTIFTPWCSSWSATSRRPPLELTASLLANQAPSRGSPFGPSCRQAISRSRAHVFHRQRKVHLIAGGAVRERGALGRLVQRIGLGDLRPRSASAVRNTTREALGSPTTSQSAVRNAIPFNSRVSSSSRLTLAGRSRGACRRRSVPAWSAATRGNRRPGARRRRTGSC